MEGSEVAVTAPLLTPGSGSRPAAGRKSAASLPAPRGGSSSPLPPGHALRDVAPSPPRRCPNALDSQIAPASGTKPRCQRPRFPVPRADGDPRVAVGTRVAPRAAVPPSGGAGVCRREWPAAEDAPVMTPRAQPSAGPSARRGCSPLSGSRQAVGLPADLGRLRRFAVRSGKIGRDESENAPDERLATSRGARPRALHSSQALAEPLSAPRRTEGEEMLGGGQEAGGGFPAALPKRRLCRRGFTWRCVTRTGGCQKPAAPRSAGAERR